MSDQDVFVAARVVRQRWEYMRLEFDDALPVERMTLLDDAGLEGWELVQIIETPLAGGSSWAMFKRPYVPDE